MFNLPKFVLLKAIVGLSGVLGGYLVLKMPGKSFRGPMPPLTQNELDLRTILMKNMRVLASEIGERNLYQHANLSRTAGFLEESLKGHGCLVSRQKFYVDSKDCYNVIGERPGKDRGNEIIVVGAHYDSLYGTTGVNDNGSGVIALLAVAHAVMETTLSRTVRFVGFANEEPPYFQTENMGSWVYAKQCRSNEDNIIAMISLETIGYYSDVEDSQKYPPPFNLAYPSTGNFLAFVGNIKSAKLVKRCIRFFRHHVKFPSEGLATFEFIPGIGWSDHWAFWQEGYPALMVTDTAPYRYPYYHTPEDTFDKIDFDKLARVVNGLTKVITGIANE